MRDISKQNLVNTMYDQLYLEITKSCTRAISDYKTDFYLVRRQYEQKRDDVRKIIWSDSWSSKM